MALFKRRSLLQGSLGFAAAAIKQERTNQQLAGVIPARP